MKLVNTCLCRSNLKVYERLDLVNVPDGHHVVVRPPVDGPDGVLPCRLFYLSPAAKGQARFVAVFPETGVPQARYELVELDKTGSPVQTLSRTIDFERAKWASRLNYRIRREECYEFRNCDEGKPWGQTLIEVTQVIPDAERVVVRGAFTTPARKEHDIHLVVANSQLSPVEADFIPMGASQQPSRIGSAIQLYRYNFSVRLPRSLDHAYLFGWDAMDFSASTFFELTPGIRNGLLGQTERLFMSAGLDPYYPEWHRLHSATLDDLEIEKDYPFDEEPVFSIVVPLYKTPLDLLDAMVDSVRRQSYGRWQLVLVNASPEDERLCERVDALGDSDERIVCFKLEENLGISLNTNAGIKRATGDFVCFLDHDDVIEPETLFEYAKVLNDHPTTDLIYCDEDNLMPDGSLRAPFFKPDFDVDLLRTKNYIAHFLCVRKTLLDALKPSDPSFDGAQDHNLTLQAVERARYIHHVPKALYHWRVCETSSAQNADNKLYAIKAGIKAVSCHLERLGINATVSEGHYPFTYRVIYEPPAPAPLVSIVIPTCDHADILKTCVDSILEKTTYENYEIVLVENNSKDPATFSYYDTLLTTHADRVRIERWDGEFNYSKIVNFGVERSKGDYLLLLNNDTELLTPDWLEKLVGICSRQEVGAAGVLLYFPDDTIQHAGVCTAGLANHLFRDMPRGNDGYFHLADCQRQLSAVTAACMMVRRTVFEQVCGFDETLAVSYNDVDFCLKLRNADYVVVYTPEVELYHYESLSRGLDTSGTKLVRQTKEQALLRCHWSEHFALGDPYYTPNVRQEYPLNSYYVF